MKFLLCSILLMAGFASCENLTNEQEITRGDLDQQMAEIQALIDTGNCTAASQCNFMPYGSKACGGPQGFLVFSNTIDVDKLKSMVERYTKDEANYNNQNGIMSDCSLPAEPQQLDCQDGNCVRIE